MDSRNSDIWQDSIILFEKSKKTTEFYPIKPDLLKLLAKIKNCEFDHKIFQILNTLAIEHKSWIVNDLDILRMTVSILTDLLHNAESEKLHELGVKWTVRMLRWLLVVDIEIEEISHLKKCFLIALPRQEFYLEQMRIALVQLSDKILTFIQVSDLSLLKVSLDGFAEYFCLDPILLLQDEIVFETDKILAEMIAHNCLNHLTDAFLSNLIIEFSSQYYVSLKDAHKKELCRSFIDIFESQILQFNNEVWFISWLAQDLEQLRKLADFISSRPNMKIFLEQQVKDKIIQYGCLRRYHSARTYSDIFISDNTN